MTAQGASGPHWIADRLDVRLAQRRLLRAQIEGLVAALAGAHGEPAAAPAADGPALAARAAAARAEIEALAPALAEAAAVREAAVRAAFPALDERAARAGARSLHGALRCERVHVDPRGRADLGPRAEGACGDPAEDVAALALELAVRGAPDAAAAFVGAWAEASGDHALYRVLDARLALAALEAAARVLREAPEADRAAAQARAEALLAAAAALAAPVEPPFVIAVAGGVASGKSTLAARLAEAHGAVVVSADAARPAGLASLEPDADGAAYAELFRRASEVVAAGRRVILDACFATRAQREALRRWAEARGLPLLLAECRADAAAVRSRLAERARRQGREPAEWLAVHRRVASAWEPVRELPREQHVALDTSRELEPCVERVARAMQRRRSGQPHRVRHRSARSAPRGASALAYKA